MPSSCPRVPPGALFPDAHLGDQELVDPLRTNIGSRALSLFFLPLSLSPPPHLSLSLSLTRACTHTRAHTHTHTLTLADFTVNLSKCNLSRKSPCEAREGFHQWRRGSSSSASLGSVF